jgi:CheY-like chemotaxis protein
VTKILCVMSDLFFLVKILDAAKKLGIGAEFVKDRDVALEKLRGLPPLVILDLNCTGADPIGIVKAMKNDPATKGIPVVAFVSHVQVDLKQLAQDSGCDLVLARSAFAQNLPEVLESYVTARS